MKKKLNIKKTITFAIVLILVIDAVVFLSAQFGPSTHITSNNSKSAAVKDIDSTIIADGTVTAQDEADLHFQTGGKLASLPYKEGDTVSQGATIAQLDTYVIQQQLTQALNSYKIARDNFDQAQAGQTEGAFQHTSTQSTTNGTQTYTTSQNSFGGDIGYTYLNDVAKRIVDENQANLDNSVINVQIANYALQMATITSPINGILTHEDVTVAGQNVTPETTFTVADPSTKVFRANVPASDIDFISKGMNASVILDGVQNKITGTITNIYPSKITSPDGEEVYQVDIQSNDIKNSSKLDQSGTAIIMTNAQNVILVPAWTVLSDKYVWVDNSGKPELKAVTVGKLHGSEIEITGGLSKNDRVITDPNVITAKKYQLL